MRYFFIFLLIWLAWRIFRRALEKAAKPEKPAALSKDGEKISPCAHCGLYMPESEMTRDLSGHYYCSVAHEKLAKGGGK